MRILLLASWYPDATRPQRGVFFREQAEALLRAGHEVVVLVTERNSYKHGASLKVGVSKAGFKLAIENSLPVYRSSKTWWFQPLLRFFGWPTFIHPWILANGAQRVFPVIQQNHGCFDLIHAHSAIWGGVVALSLYRRFHIPYVLTEHRSNFMSNTLPRRSEAILGKVFRNASAVITVSMALKKQLQSLGLVEASRCQVVPNMVSPHFFKVKRNKVREGLCLIAVGGLIHRKRFDLVLEALAIARNQIPELCLRIVGSGPLERELQHRTKELGLTGCVIWAGPLLPVEVAVAMAESDALILASDHETFGVVVAEALSTGTSAIVTQCGGPEEIVDINSGIIIPTGNKAALAKAIIQFYNQRGDFDSNRIRSEALSRYSEAAIIGQLGEIYAVATARS